MGTYRYHTTDERRAPYLVKLLRSYMEDRSFTYPSNGTQISRDVTCGVPQGSVHGPTLWNVFYDDLLRQAVPEGPQLVTFADDVALVVTAKTTALLEAVANPSLAVVEEWIRNHGLSLSYNKTEAVMLKRKWAYDPPRLSLSGADNW